MQDDVVDQMIKGIHDSAVFVVFITKKYIDKVGSGNDADNCRKEFTYADRKKTAKMMIPVPMERCVGNPTSWVGPVGMSLGGLLYEASFCDDEEATFAKNLDNLAQQILRKCRESEGSEGGEATVSATATLTAVAAVPMATATSASLPDEVATWLAQLDIDASPQLVGAFDALGFKRMDDFADLEEEDIATLEAAMKRLEVKRFRRDRQSREEAKKVAREAAAREDRLRQEAVERSRKEAAAAREKAVAREKSAKEKVAREKAAREKVEREKAAAARAKALVARINAAKEENDCRGVVDAVREGASSALVAEKGCGALLSLAVNVDNRKRIAEAGGIAMILRMLNVHGESNAEVAEEGCAALMNLAVNDDNEKRIGEEGGIAIILRMLDVQGESSALVAEEGCGALWSLAFNDDNKSKILAANGVSIVERMKSTWASNEGVQKNANGALRKLR